MITDTVMSAKSGTVVEKGLAALRERTGYGQEPCTPGLDADVLARYGDSDLEKAVEAALEAITQEPHASFVKWSEADQIKTFQQDFVNFYQEEVMNPYVALAARGPWIITSKGAVIHDSGGYGMLGFGHGPEAILEALGKPAVMANVMTAHPAQKIFAEAMKKEIGHKNPRRQNLHHSFICLNSGSEGMSAALRISDVASKKFAADKKPEDILYLSLQTGFHGRTDKPARVSDSSRKVYQRYLKSFEQNQNRTIPPNDVEALEQAFSQAAAEGKHIEAFLLEPVMGEGNPGLCVTPAFYRRARELCTQHQTVFIVDSIQAGLRSFGVLSVVDYPGFENEDAPDIESFSKAVNAGQFPLSVLALRREIRDIYARGIYGNTMTTNPKALEVATIVLRMLTPEVRENIVAVGSYFEAELKKLMQKHPDKITKVQGTGLLICAEIDPAYQSVVGFDGLEQRMRRNGIGVIHGGVNALRYTPHFRITRGEVDMIIAQMEACFSAES